MAQLSIVKGSASPPLSDQTISDLIRDNSIHHASNIALKAGKQSSTYNDLDRRSSRVSSALIRSGIEKGEHVGILAANRAEYIDLFLGIGRIGRVAVALNPTDSPEQLSRAVVKRSCKALFIARCGEQDMSDHVRNLVSEVLGRRDSGALQKIVAIDIEDINQYSSGSGSIQSYEAFLSVGADQASSYSDEAVREEERTVNAQDVLTLQFTSGTTGEPKAAMLTHRGVINNALHLSSRLNLSPDDILCCPASLFRTFGIIMGFLTAFVRGTQLVLPSANFDAGATITNIIDNKCTALLGENRLFNALLAERKAQNARVDSVRTCLAAGAVVPVETREALRGEMGIGDFVIAHGQTEMGPMVFITGTDDPRDTKSVGRIMPHRVAKVVNDEDSSQVLPKGQKGELLVSGYGLLTGYYGDPEKTDAALRRDDEDGTLWFHTGDEASIDKEGYCYYGGRLGDIIKTEYGGRVYPDEIETRLLEHDSIIEASVVGVREGSGKGETVGAFLKAADDSRPDDGDVLRWVEEGLGSEKVPKHLFWAGNPEVGDGLLKTYNGKPRKRDMSDLAAKILQNR